MRKVFSGSVCGRLGLDVVSVMRSGEIFSSVHESIKLQGLQRSSGNSKDDVHRVFGIEGETSERKMQ